MLCKKYEKVYIREASTVPYGAAVPREKTSIPWALGIFAAQFCIAQDISVLRGR